MIKHHPTFEMLKAYVTGDLPASLAAGVSIHADKCDECRKQIALLTEQIAEVSFEPEHDPLHFGNVSDETMSVDFEQMLDNICSDDSITLTKPTEAKTITLRDTPYQLPRAMQHMEISSSANIGKLSRARVMLDEGEIHTSLLHIEPGGGVPMHTHNGFELTVLVEGSFTDEMGEYFPGDFIMLDGQHVHHPVSEQGCLCYTVANAPQKFTQGINKLLNPIGNFIY
ncbi:ChrR family anti-sigma-E factor [Thalassotalea sp. 1_MG-2023]|uniref:ChrR family anti-sigma-E factor n=1 Tax=Thalassotalea sp. 1_MG-2023 TaxID=3062680 RepID=UPI0026E23632|nr:ChrR family anti-sigma-E factor [Thalassotalea sp. 1_MG-2023]MDO6427898.1 ChrR family anti-sigma-E factor [Thalassotalea sp. 1_MG-2023]